MTDAHPPSSDGEVVCPLCGVPFAEHHVSVWYPRVYDVWSTASAGKGRACFTLRRAQFPTVRTGVVPPRGRRKGSREGVDFDDPTLRKRARVMGDRHRARVRRRG